ncbi:hypothetical protein R5R35_012649 [Gryllus longicercus]|uniref:Non-structural maintenance of chromosomes element 4 n=1 Tax=Gryllus longicercus TaxID=2509291 RepID=A0AAN9V4H5_9ORTH
MVSNGQTNTGFSEKYKVHEEKETLYNEQMRNLLNQSIDLREAAERGEETCVEETTNIILKADDVLQNASSSSTAFLDAQILHTSSYIYKNLVEKMDSRLSEFKAKEYAERLLLHLEGKSACQNIWSALEDETALAFNNTGGWTWQFGAIDIEEEVIPGQKPTRQRRDMTVDAPMKNPIKVQNLEKQDENLEVYMKSIMKLIETWEKANKAPLQFWDFVLHPTSFAETIENIFHVSHLVKEGQILLSLDRDGLPVIKAIAQKDDGKSKAEISRVPVAVSLDPKQWEDLVRAYGIERPMIRTRIAVEP